jgi:ESF2/ABP1 family protein
MSIRKRNEYLEGDDSEDELDRSYESEAEEGRGAIANKRRKIESGSEASSDEEEAVENRSEATQTAPKDARFDLSKFNSADEEEGDHNGDGHDEGDRPTTTTTARPKSRDLRAYEKAQTKLRKSGVIYISRVPPFMKPQTLRHLLEPHAPRKGLGRVFLTPEDHAQHTSRVKRGGNKKKSFTDGWVEFHSKKEAQVAAETLNGNIMGGKKGGFYHDDLWNVKYLRGFKWEHLTEQIANENAERAARVREEVRRTRRENKRFVEDVERGKMLVGMERKMEGKGKGVEGMRKGVFKQKKVKTADSEARVEKTAQRALGKIF